MDNPSQASNSADSFQTQVKHVNATWLLSIRITVCYDMTLYSLALVYRHFGGAYALHLQGKW
jgi:hypothetical protein